MRIAKKAWHARLYMLAWIQNRSWFEWLFLPSVEREWDELDEDVWKARSWLTAAQYRVNNVRGDPSSFEQPVTVEEARADYEAIYAVLEKAWNRLERARKMFVLRVATERRIAARERFNSGRLALCPYFWSVVLAVTIYLPLKGIGWFFGRIHAMLSAISTTAAESVAAFFRRLGAQIAEVIRRNQKALETLGGWLNIGIRHALRFGLVLTAGWVTYIATPWAIEKAEGWQRDTERRLIWQAEDRQLAALEANRAARRQAEHEAWLKTPDGLASRAAQREDERSREEERRRTEAEWNSAASLRQRLIYEAQVAARNAKWEAEDTMRQIKGDISSYTSWIKFLAGLAIFCSTIFFVAGLADLWRRYAAPRPTVRNAVRAIRTGSRFIANFFVETAELIAAFAKAIKEHVCPFIQFTENGQEQSS